MKSLLLEKTKYILTNSWLGLFIPAGVHQLINLAEKSTAPPPEKPQGTYTSHPAESRISRSLPSKAKP